MSLNKGQQLGPYEIVGQIGAGGMGEVFRARDIRLNRSVAIKVLPPQFSHNSTLKQRFEREAKAISSLSHPNICALYDIGAQDGTTYLVMEYLEGITLAEKLAKGPLPLEETLNYAVQICDAMDNAHRTGIVHRDLKPGNIMLTKTGVKLLDFGLAKASTGYTGWPSGNFPDRTGAASHLNQPTLKEELTQEGTILGTLSYMAPEQLEGRECDSRTDIFAFGSVLYEMVTGRKAFAGKSHASVIGAILKETPQAVHEVQPAAPKALDPLLQRCLAKDPDDRWQTARDLKFQLQCIKRSDEPFPALRPTSAWKYIAAAATISAVVAATTAALLMARSRPMDEPKNLTLRIPQMKFAINSVVTLSPQGSHVVYCPNHGSEPIYIRALNGTTVEPIPGTEGAQFAFFSPDGLQLGYFQNKKLHKLVLANRVAQPICDVPEHPVRGASWGDDGFIYFATRFDSVIKKVAASGGSPQPITRLLEGEVGHNHPYALPNGKGLLFTILNGDSQQIGALSPHSSSHHIVQKNASHPQWSSTGHLLFLEDDRLMAAPFNTRKLLLDKAAVALVSRVNNANQPFAASPTLLVYFSEDGNKHQLSWVTTNGLARQIYEFQNAIWEPFISPGDPSKVLLRFPMPQCQLWLLDLNRNQLARFAAAPGDDNHTAVWSPDGTRVAFGRMGMMPRLIVKSVRDQQEQVVWTNKFLDVVSGFSPDGAQLAVTLNSPGTDLDIYLVKISEGSARPWRVTPHSERGAIFSPDGKWIAYTSDETGSDEVYLSRASGDETAVFASTGGGTEPLWHPSGEKLFYRRGSKVYQVKVQTEPSLSVSLPELLFDGDFEENVVPVARLSYDFDPVGERFLMIRRTGGRSEELQVKLHWAEQLK